LPENKPKPGVRQKILVMKNKYFSFFSFMRIVIGFRNGELCAEIETTAQGKGL